MKELDAETQNKINQCKAYINKSSLVGVSNFVFCMDKYNRIILTHSLGNVYDSIKIPDFVDCIGINFNDTRNQGDLIVLNDESLEFEDINTYSKYLNAFAFSSINSITFGKNVAEVSSNAFMYSGIKNIIVNNKLDNIGKECFFYCKKLESINLENAKVGFKIGRLAFSNCISLKYIDLTNAAIIDSMAFTRCTKLTKVKLPELDEYTTISRETFLNCKSINEININENIEIVGESAFESNYNLSKVTLGKHIKLIDTKAFGNCSNEKELVVEIQKDSLDELKIDKCAFIDTSNVKIIYDGKEIKV